MALYINIVFEDPSQKNQPSFFNGCHENQVSNRLFIIELPRYHKLNVTYNSIYNLETEPAQVFF